VSLAEAAAASAAHDHRSRGGTTVEGQTSAHWRHRLGKGANQAVAAAKLGAEVVMVTNLGDDTLFPTATSVDAIRNDGLRRLQPYGTR
jgi:sugar/nucleoside kinase (ribokinase family)